MKAIWKGKTIAESEETIVVEGNHYFPAETVNRQYLKESDTYTTCPWKGEASYYHIEVDGQMNEDAAWNYPAPKDAAGHIKDYVAFGRGVEVSD
jgi:uncharacterized protein (DUF427 family)